MPETATSKAFYESPIGRIELRGSEAGLSGLDFVDAREPGTRCPVPRSRRPSSPAASSPPSAGSPPLPLAEAMAQLDEYFRGVRTSFTVKLDLSGTAFQQRVWGRLLEVGYGQTTTYKALASAVGNPAATRAVGGANHSNPVSIIVPCHRVVGSDGRLTGYGGGLWRKEWLLRHEGGGRLFV